MTWDIKYFDRDDHVMSFGTDLDPNGVLGMPIVSNMYVLLEH